MPERGVVSGPVRVWLGCRPAALQGAISESLRAIPGVEVTQHPDPRQPDVAIITPGTVMVSHAKGSTLIVIDPERPEELKRALDTVRSLASRHIVAPPTPAPPRSNEPFVAKPAVKGRFFAPRNRVKLAMTGAVLAAAAILVGSTLANFNATTTNSSNSFSSGTIVLSSLKTGGTTCLSTAVGVAITTNVNTSCDDLMAATLQVPGTAATPHSVTLKNTGSVNAASFTLTPAACSGAPNGSGYQGSDTSAGFCGKVDVTIQETTPTNTCIYPAGAGNCPALANTSTLSGLGSHAAFTLSSDAPTLTNMAAGNATGTVFTIATMLDTTATNADQGMTATLSLSWAIGT